MRIFIKGIKHNIRNDHDHHYPRSGIAFPKETNPQKKYNRRGEEQREPICNVKNRFSEKVSVKKTFRFSVARRNRTVGTHAMPTKEAEPRQRPQAEIDPPSPRKSKNHRDTR